ncbi:ATP-binding protein [Paracoccus liaowanqingii]|uniref:ATP-binding protein n=1 Tax=Paracoccus liaowanqingii TaxID=2560053 RepID=A0A4P7HNS3_9RHOB|nr:AAA family ATPase [Paracoccus liaowanqingii]QBX35017.1 ATP-binding protein [Paracoccus liaowanqingii]
MSSFPVFFTISNLEAVRSKIRNLDKFILISLSENGVCRSYIHTSRQGRREQFWNEDEYVTRINIAFMRDAEKNSLLSFESAYKIVVEATEEKELLSYDQKTVGFTFASLALTSDSYRQIISRIGVKAGIEALLATNDILATKEYQPNKAIIRNKRLQQRLLKSLATNSEQLFLIDHGRSILDDTERAAIDHARPEFSCGFQLCSGQSYQFQFNFGQTTDLGRRAAILIGKNGSGKSQTLRHIAKSALTVSKGNWHGNFTPSRVLAFYTGSRVSKIYPPQTLSRRISGYKVHNLAHEDSTSNSSVISVLLSMIEKDTEIANLSRFVIFQDIIKEAENRSRICVYHNDYGPINILTIARPYPESGTITFATSLGERIDQFPRDFVASIDSKKGLFKGSPGDFSSGEEAYIRFSVFASAHTENGSLLLLDEPEVYLHPQFIDALMGSLHKVLELTGSVAVVATHSAYIVRCVEEELVHILRGGLSEPTEVQKPRMKTFGADVGMISLFVFGEDEMATTLTRAERFHNNRDDNTMTIRDSLKNIASEDLISRIVNAHEEN